MNAGTVLTRSFSRYGLNMIRLPTEEAAMKGTQACRMTRSAALLSLLGVSFSMFSVSQLPDSASRLTAK